MITSPFNCLRSPALSLLFLTGAIHGIGQDACGDSEDHFYLPPAWAERVVFYHTFIHGIKNPEINRAGLSIESTGQIDTGFTGVGLAATERQNKPLLRLTGSALSVHRPLTISLWWKLNEPMTEESNFALAQLGNHQGRHNGFIAAFVRGKGQWGALGEPTFIAQLRQFPGIPNRDNGKSGGRVWTEPGQWHHLAIAVNGTNKAELFWDGRRRTVFNIVGRHFQEGDTNALSLGPHWLFHPMTIDEVVVVNRVLSADEIADYHRAASALRNRFSPEQITNTSDYSKGK